MPRSFDNGVPGIESICLDSVAARTPFAVSAVSSASVAFPRA
jgi:hypothetical protein